MNVLSVAGSAAASAAPPSQRTRWLEAGQRLAQREGRRGGYRLAEVAEEAGLPAGGLRRAFGSYDHYCLALLQSLFDDLREQVVLVTTDEPPGRHRAWLGVIAYLDRSLQRAGLRRWFFSRQAQSPRIATALRRQNQVYFVILGGEFRDIGWTHPQLAARLFIGMVLDIAHAESSAGHALPAFRETLWTYLDAG